MSFGASKSYTLEWVLPGGVSDVAVVPSVLSTPSADDTTPQP